MHQSCRRGTNHSDSSRRRSERRGNLKDEGKGNTMSAGAMVELEDDVEQNAVT